VYEFGPHAGHYFAPKNNECKRTENLLFLSPKTYQAGPLPKTDQKPIIGRIEKIDLPELSIFGLDAKIDTGAYTSSLHCHKIFTEKENGKEFVRFHVLDPDHPEYEEREYRSPVHKVKRVKSSNGMIEERVVIKQKVRFFGKKGTILLSLTNRSEMKYPVLIGRRFLEGRYTVDVSKKFIFKGSN
jgi:hypothetical protein